MNSKLTKFPFNRACCVIVCCIIKEIVYVTQTTVQFELEEKQPTKTYETYETLSTDSRHCMYVQEENTF